MEKLLTLRRGFAAGEKNDPRDMETITEALRATGFLKRPTSGGKPPAQAEVGRALRDFQDREGLVVDGRAAPLGPTERHLSNAVQRAAVLAARPARTGPLRFQPITGEAAGALRRTANGLMRTGDHRGAVSLFRRAFEDDPEGGVPEAIHFAGLIERMDRKKGARFRGELVKMAEEVDPALARHIAAGEIVGGGGTSAGTSLLSRAAVGAKSGGDERAAPAANTAAKAQADGDMADMFRRIVPPTVADRTGDVQNRMANPTGGPDEGLIRKGFDPSIPEAAREKLQDARDRASQVLLGSHFIGRDLARENYVHYLRASGQDKVWSREQVRDIDPFHKAEISNRQAFPAKIVEDWETALVGLKEGGQIRLSEVGVTKRFPSPRDELRDSILESGFDNDFMLAFGGVNFKAIGSLTAERRGNVIIIRGLVRHGFQDKYDFDFLFKDEAEVLERHGEAKIYVNKAEWYQEVEGTFRFVDDKLVAPNFRWTDASTEGGGPRDR